MLRAGRGSRLIRTTIPGLRPVQPSLMLSRPCLNKRAHVAVIAHPESTCLSAILSFSLEPILFPALPFSLASLLHHTAFAMLGPAALALLFLSSFCYHEVAAANTPQFLDQVRVSHPAFALSRVQQHRLFRASSSITTLPERPFRYPLPVQSCLPF